MSPVEAARDGLLLVANVGPPVIGGISSYVTNLAEAVRSEFDVRVLTYPAGLVYLEARGRRNPIRFLFHGLFVLGGVFAVLRMRARHPRLVVHSHSAAFCLLVAVAGKALGATAVHTLHSPPRGPSWILRRLGPTLDAVAFVSPALRDLYVMTTGIGNDRVDILPGAVPAVTPEGRDSREALRHDLALELGLPPNAFIVLFLGRVVEDKGVHVLARATARLPGPGIRVLVVGPSGPAPTDVEYLKGISALAGPDPTRFHVLGAVPSKRLAELLRIADVLVVPSLWPEPAPVVVAEAFAHGVPVIASEIGGLPFLVPPEAGLLVPAGDDAALANALEALVKDPDQRARLSRGALAQARRRHSPEAFAEAHRRFYGRVRTGPTAGARAPGPVSLDVRPDRERGIIK